ncbi:hypothetical protein KIN20_003628 [Parelaphostrongylus tenuis]|uniref:Uncharacterized protein n=1 Tax=Parelaphostrongylus tenuis TaxID=148309 RepID=A0AAD5QDV1_PARTN|nr:hypothetical protein KIN20_003628 [Parelaphostrongylus tenuis]
MFFVDFLPNRIQLSRNSLSTRKLGVRPNAITHIRSISPSGIETCMLLSPFLSLLWIGHVFSLLTMNTKQPRDVDAWSNLIGRVWGLLTSDVNSEKRTPYFSTSHF